MRLEHRFSVPAPIDVVWGALLDPERVAPCMPGAAIESVDGPNFSGTVKVKLGPVSLLYKGKGEFLETDETARKVVIKASGKDSRGNGTAAATVTVTLTASGDSTEGEVDTDLNITGKPAQFGRGMIGEVGGKILNDFADRLAAQLGAKPEPAKPEPAKPEPAKPEPAEPAAAATPEAAGQQPPAREVANNATPVRAVPEPSAPTAPIDLMDYAGSSVAKRIAPVAAAVALLTLVFVILRRRKHRGK